MIKSNSKIDKSLAKYTILLLFCFGFASISYAKPGDKKPLTNEQKSAILDAVNGYSVDVDPTAPLGWVAPTIDEFQSDLSGETSASSGPSKPSLQALICNKSICKAIINGTLLSIGDKFGQYTLTKIDKDTAELTANASGDENTTQQLSEAIKAMPQSDMAAPTKLVLSIFVDIFATKDDASNAMPAIATSAVEHAPVLKSSSATSNNASIIKGK